MKTTTLDVNMKYTPSINIEQSAFDEQKYIVTQNALNVVGNIVSSYVEGIHSFNIIGSYGTGKSNFILALEHSLSNASGTLISNNGQFNGYTDFRFYNIVGDYVSLYNILMDNLPVGQSTNNVFDNLKSLISAANNNGEFVFIVIDEFGKLLEFAANNNPEKELYLFQKLTEIVNDEKRDVILITTLHQNFSAYAQALTETQRQEWSKVKGRFKEIVFNEPVEQLLYLAARRINGYIDNRLNKDFESLYNLAISSKFSSASLNLDTALRLYPMDLFAAQSLTLSIQRYGQNERSLFSFLESVGNDSLKSFSEAPHKTYSLADVYDYDIYNFYSYISEANADSSSWAGIRVALERVEGLFDEKIVINTSKIVKAIGMINLFGNAGVHFGKTDLAQYAKLALDIESPEYYIDLLNKYKVIRYAEYKSRFILFEGTDVNIEDELLNASNVVPRTTDVVAKLQQYINLPTEFANAYYYTKGTPRFFKYIISDGPVFLQPKDDIDGYIVLVFNEGLSLETIKSDSASEKEAVVYVLFKHADQIINHLWMLDKLAYVQGQVDSTDKVAQREIKLQKQHEENLLNSSILNALYNYTDDIVWLYNGEEVNIKSKTDFNKFLSKVCEEVYYATPTFINEMINKNKSSGTMSIARVNLLSHLLEYSMHPNLGFEDDVFPPEKTLYLTLLKKTGIHKEVWGTYELSEPTDPTFEMLWKACEDFMEESKDKPLKLGILINVLKSRPFKLKQGVVDLWLPIYLIIKKNEYSLYSDSGVYIPEINREVLDILQKAPSNYQVKAFNVDGVKLDLFNKYREALSLSQDDELTSGTLIETIRPFLIFYRNLNRYSKQTKRLKRTTLAFRQVLSTAKDPEKTFFEDLPHALGFKDTDIANNADVLKSYVSLLQNAIRELRSCYTDLINRIEQALTHALNLKSMEFGTYKSELEHRYSCVKDYLLTDKQKAMLNRILSKTSNKITWYQSLAYIILDKPLDTLLDEEEKYLIDNLIHSFKELEKYIDISNRNFQSEDDFIRVELISKRGAVTPQIFQLDKTKARQVEKVENKLNRMLSGDKNVDAYALLNLLKKRIGDE